MPERTVPRVKITSIPQPDHLGAEGAELVVHGGDLLAELETTQVIVAFAAVVEQRCKVFVIKTAGQHPHGAEGECIAIEQTALRGVGHDGLKDIVQDGVREGEAGIGDQAHALGELDAEPALHAATLHDDRRWNQRVTVVTREFSGELADETLKVIALVNDKSGHLSPQSLCTEIVSPESL